MSPLPDEQAHQWAERMQDAIADNSKVRDGLHDEAAISLVDWGANAAEQIAARMARPDTPAPAPEDVENAGYTLSRLLIRLNWLVTYRHKKDAVWLARTFDTANQLNRELYGDAAPTFGPEQIHAWINQQDDRSEAEQIAALLAQLTPPAAPADTPPPAPPAAPPPALHAPGLPGRPAAEAPPAPWVRPQRRPFPPGDPDEQP